MSSYRPSLKEIFFVGDGYYRFCRTRYDYRQPRKEKFLLLLPSNDRLVVYIVFQKVWLSYRIDFQLRAHFAQLDQQTPRVHEDHCLDFCNHYCALC